MRESVTALFHYQDQVFIIRRSESLSVFPGYYAFPGGKVDKEDKLHDESYHLRALQREILEELEFDIFNDKRVLKTSLMGHASAPEFNPYRFKTFFYHVELSEKVEFKLCLEFDSGRWYKFSELYKLMDQGEILTVPPIHFLLRNFPNYTGKEIKVVSFDVPKIEPLKDLFVLYPYSNTFPPANRTNCFLIIGDKNILIDPSPKDKGEFDSLYQKVRGSNIRMVFITHHHLDHHEFAVEMAKKLNCQVGISRDSFNRIRKKWGRDYFQDREIVFFKEGDKLCHWLGEDVMLMEVPGHDEGQLAPYVKSKKWIIVGDLIQTIGTVVIGDDEGDMKKYFSSLQRVIDFSPRVVLPSHGIALGGTHKLKQTLLHRKMREKKIDELYKSEKGDIKKILENVYQGLEPFLIPYALKTIYAHLMGLGYIEKLKK